MDVHEALCKNIRWDVNALSFLFCQLQKWSCTSRGIFFVSRTVERLYKYIDIDIIVKTCTAERIEFQSLVAHVETMNKYNIQQHHGRNKEPCTWYEVHYRRNF